MKYTVVLEQEPDGGYVLSIPALPGCQSQGNTREEALANLREAAKLYLEGLRGRDEPIPREVETTTIELDFDA